MALVSGSYHHKKNQIDFTGVFLKKTFYFIQ